MKLSDIMSYTGLDIFPVVGLMIFLAVFLSVLWQVYGRSRMDEMHRAAALPLHDDVPVAKHTATTTSYTPASAENRS